MKKNKLFYITLALLGFAVMAYAAVDHEFPNNRILYGDNTTSNKSIEIRTGASPNPIISIDGTANTFSLNKDTLITGDNLTVGDGTATDKKIILDNGSGGTNPFILWDESESAIAFSDDGSTTKTLSSLSVGATISELADNIGFTVVMAANAVTVTLKQKDASTDPDGTNSVKIGFRDSTITTGGYDIITVTTALSVVIPSGATLGTRDTFESKIYIYALDNAGTVELAVINKRIDDEDILHSTTLIDGTSDDARTLYSTAARAGVAIRLIGVFTSTQATAGTWATGVSEIFSGNRTENSIVTETPLRKFTVMFGQAAASNGDICTGSPCTIFNEIGGDWVNGNVTRIATGQYDFTSHPVFKVSENIQCSCQSNGGSATISNCAFGAEGGTAGSTFKTDSSGILRFNNTGNGSLFTFTPAGAGVDSFVMVTCYGEE